MSLLYQFSLAMAVLAQLPSYNVSANLELVENYPYRQDYLTVESHDLYSFLV